MEVINKNETMQGETGEVEVASETENLVALRLVKATPAGGKRLGVPS